MFLASMKPYFDGIKFYAYGVHVDGAVKYVGKGQDSGTYSRMRDYDPPPTCSRVARSVRVKLAELYAAGKTWETKIIREIPTIPLNSSLEEIRKSEAEAYRAEAELIEYYGLDNLWNETTGGHSSWHVSEDTRARMSEGQKRRIPNIPSDKAKALMSRAKLGIPHTKEHNASIAAALREAWGTTRPHSVYTCTAGQLRAVPAFKRSSNALFRDRAIEEAFILKHVGSTHTELQAALSALLGRHISTVATYNLIKRYGVSFVGNKTCPGNTPKERRVEAVKRIGLRRKGLLETYEEDEDFYIDKSNLGENRVIFVVSGASGSGKSWVCRQLEGVKYIEHDAFHGLKPRVEALVEATRQPLPIVFDPLARVTTYINKNPEFKFRLACIVESNDTLLQRLKGRGSPIIELTEAFLRRIKRIESYSKNYAEFSGTSDEVLAWLRQQLQAQPQPTAP